MSYIIVLWDYSKIQISESMGEKLKKAIQEKSIESFTVNQSLYAVGDVRRIVTKDEAYQMFPTEGSYLQQLADAPSANDFIKLNRGQE